MNEKGYNYKECVFISEFDFTKIVSEYEQERP